MTFGRSHPLFWRLAALVLLAACGRALAARPCPAPVVWSPVAQGVWAWNPIRESDVAPDNRGHVAPVTALIDGRRALVIDPGPSRAHGQVLRRSLACRFGARVVQIVNTHAHAETVLANAAFIEGSGRPKISILANAPTRAAMARRCPGCLASLTDKLGVPAMAGTRIVLPTKTLREGDTVLFGPHRLQVLRVESGHTEGDLVLWHARERLLWAGGLVYGNRLPELAQGNLVDWLGALDRLIALRPSAVIGATVSFAVDGNDLPPALVSTRAYLRDLRAQVLVAMDEGRQAHEAGTLELPAYADWAGYRARQGFNVQRAWRELEPRWMETGGTAASVPQDVRR